MTDVLFDTMVRVAKANAYDRLAMVNRELKETCDQLLEALQMAMRQLDDPDEDIHSIRDHAVLAIEKARRL